MMNRILMLLLATAFLLSFGATDGLITHSNVARFSRIPLTSIATTSTPSFTRLYGGYDATIGADPNTPIQIYCSEERTPEDLCTFLCLAELGLKYEVMSELPNPIPDWFLRIHPDGNTPALRNPVDESLNNEIVSNTPTEIDKVNQYLCKVYLATMDDDSKSCTLLPSDEESMDTMQAMQSQIHKVVLPACRAFLENEDPTQESTFQSAAEDALRSLFQNQSLFLMGSDLTLVDIQLFTHLKSIFLDLNEKKSYTLPSSTMGSMKSWHDACAARPAFQQVLSKQE